MYDLAIRAGVTFVKTCMGFRGETNPDEVRLLARHVRGRCAVKATGGIRSVGDVLAMLEAGAVRIGTSRGVAILEELASIGRSDRPGGGWTG